jgi:restriction endonuclease Mrr
MAFPDYEALADALLCFIFLNGCEKHQVRAYETYDPLADFFGLTHEERSSPRPDGYGGRHWLNLVQWTRQKLINEGYVEGRGRGIWGLTAKGVQRAQSVAGAYGELEKSR